MLTIIISLHIDSCLCIKRGGRKYLFLLRIMKKNSLIKYLLIKYYSLSQLSTLPVVVKCERRMEKGGRGKEEEREERRQVAGRMCNRKPLSVYLGTKIIIEKKTIAP